MVKRAVASSSFVTSPPDNSAWWSLPGSDVLAHFEAESTNGLTPEEALRRVAQYGPNSLPEEQEPGVWSSLFAAFKDPLALILTLAAVLSAGIGLALSFDTWRTLRREQGLSDRQAVELMLRLAGDEARRAT